MAKHTNKEAYFQRLKFLADVKKPEINESKFRNLGSLIDYKRAANGVAYGIIKENHHYYLKKAGIKQDPNVADFAYIGGMENITAYQYKTLAEADKQRNMIFQTINEGVTTKINIGGNKKKLNEDTAGSEINQAASKLDDLDAATSAEAQPAPVAPEGSDEMTAGLDAKPAGEVSAEEPAPELNDTPAPEGGEELPAEEPTPEGGETEPEGDEPEGGEAEPGADTTPESGEGENEAILQLQKSLGKITNTIRKTEMEDSDVKSLINTFLASFKDKLRDIDIDDRKEMANKILKVVGHDEIEDLGDTVPQNKPEGTDLGPEAGLGEEKEVCAECGGLPEYAKSRGYDTAQSFMECDDEEKANVISGYANAHNDGQNDGDFKTIAIVITPEILEKLKTEYGHEDFADKVEPFTKEMNESSDEDKMTELNELWGGLKNLGQAAVGGVKAGATAAKNAVKTGAEKVGQAATAVKQSYNAGEVPGEIKKLQDVATNLGKQIEALNKRKSAAGQPPIDVKTILKAVTQQVTGKGSGVAGLAEEVKEDPSNTTVAEPNMLKEDDETEEKKFDIDDIETPETDEESVETGEVDVKPKNDVSFAPAGQTLGVTTVKPNSNGVEIKVEPDKTVTLNMNESELKLRKYVRQRLQEKAGLKKPMLTESKKSPTLKKLDAMIDEQLKLHENDIKKKR